MTSSRGRSFYAPPAVRWRATLCVAAFLIGPWLISPRYWRSPQAITIVLSFAAVLVLGTIWREIVAHRTLREVERAIDPTDTTCIGLAVATWRTTPIRYVLAFELGTLHRRNSNVVFRCAHGELPVRSPDADSRVEVRVLPVRSNGDAEAIFIDSGDVSRWKVLNLRAFLAYATADAAALTWAIVAYDVGGKYGWDETLRAAVVATALFAPTLLSLIKEGHPTVRPWPTQAPTT